MSGEDTRMRGEDASMSGEDASMKTHASYVRSIGFPNGHLLNVRRTAMQCQCVFLLRMYVCKICMHTRRRINNIGNFLPV